MEKHEEVIAGSPSWGSTVALILGLSLVSALAFAAGLFWSSRALGGDEKTEPKVIYPKKTDLDFEGIHLEGELRNPGEFYFQRRPEEKFDSLVKRRKNFHRELLRDVVLSK